ncbi:MAG: hypothetical protein DRP38_04485 [Thermotogae bacterium]|nr:MAG: hypothetical protein DRP38_04485 [Thermotogota bacterium]
MKRRRRFSFFLFPSYLEVVITLSIVLILIGTLIPQAKGFLEKSKALKIAKEIKILEMAITSFYKLERRFPKSVDELFKNGYLLFELEGYEIENESGSVKIVLKKEVDPSYLEPIIPGIKKENGNVSLKIKIRREYM